MPDELSRRRAVLGARAVWGTVLLAAPAAVLRRCGDPPGRAIRLGTRALGARHLAEAALQRGHRSRAARRLFGAVDLSHGATMAVLAVRAPRYRTVAVVSLAISTSLAILD